MAPSAVTSVVHESTPSIDTGKNGIGQVDKSNQRNFFDDVHFLGDKEGKVVIRSPPKFDSLEDTRTYQKQHLAAAFRVFARQGFDEGVAGHISLRDPINPGTDMFAFTCLSRILIGSRALLD